MAKPELFNDAFYAWLEANGVTFSEPLGEPPFRVTVDLNQLKAGVIELVIELLESERKSLPSPLRPPRD